MRRGEVQDMRQKGRQRNREGMTGKRRGRERGRGREGIRIKEGRWDWTQAAPVGLDALMIEDPKSLLLAAYYWQPDVRLTINLSF